MDTGCAVFYYLFVPPSHGMYVCMYLYTYTHTHTLVLTHRCMHIFLKVCQYERGYECDMAMNTNMNIYIYNHDPFSLVCVCLYM